MPASNPDGYLLTAWVDASGDAGDLKGSVALEVDSKQAEKRWSVSLVQGRQGAGGEQVRLLIPASALPEGAASARLVLTASLGSGSVAVRDVRLYARSVVPFGLDGEA